MSTAVVEPHLAGSDLADARESLAYWEDRARTLPRHAVRRRREAVAMAERWSARIAEAERASYGRGMLGALVLLVAEGRLPESVRHRGRTVARRARRTAVLVAGALTAFLVAGVVAVVEVLAAIVHALT